MKKISIFGYIFVVAILVMGFFSIFSMFYTENDENLYFSFGFLTTVNYPEPLSFSTKQIIFFVLIGIAALVSLFRFISLKNETLSIISLLAPLLFIATILLNYFLVTKVGQENEVIWEKWPGYGPFYIQKNASMFMMVAALILGAIYFLFSLLTTVHSLKNKTEDIKNEQKVKNNFVTSQQNVEINQNQSLPVNDPSFTSTPNDETFNIADKLQKLREDLANGIFDESSFSETLTQEQINYIQNEDPTLSQELKKVSNSVINEPIKNSNYNNGPVDPYKQTIVPRRAADKAGAYDKPIGNIASNKYGSNAPKERRNANYDPNYEGKVFLGDSDRIWEAMKKQNRQITPKKASTDNLVSNSNIVNNLQKQKTQTIELDANNIMDPISGQQDAKNTSTPTIDWDD